MTENSELIQTNPILDIFQNMQNINSQTIANAPIELEFPKNGQLRSNEMCFYRVK